ncbi:hypothetical protein CPB83DRAFT_307525 [Crepidotus variabilis]|uniref:Uncharacterized protein n=1 Tax=Crepidotus variabilis TaxID=179855 RepID=A0A9P6EGN4_9AGAR|nr:hypothetical protein CPB83DRAFT_307525 [Crepidotus variabilis]
MRSSLIFVIVFAMVGIYAQKFKFPPDTANVVEGEKCDRRHHCQPGLTCVDGRCAASTTTEQEPEPTSEPISEPTLGPARRGQMSTIGY